MITSEPLITAEMRRLRAARPRVLQLVARAAMLRWLNEHHPDVFWLKGGSLMHNCYGSPRASFVDTDFAQPAEVVFKVKAEEARELLTIKEADFRLDLGGGKLTDTGITGILKFEDVPFWFREFTLDAEGSQVNLSITIRDHEVLDTERRTFYNARHLLADNGGFQLPGLSLEESAAEKVLGWCLKLLPKHLVDLAWVAREAMENEGWFDSETSLRLLSDKFRLERDSQHTKGVYQRSGLDAPRQLSDALLDEGDLRRFFFPFYRNPKTFGNDRDLARRDARLWLTRDEEARSDATLRNPEYVLQAVREFWLPLLQRL